MSDSSKQTNELEIYNNPSDIKSGKEKQSLIEQIRLRRLNRLSERAISWTFGRTKFDWPQEER